MMYPDIFDWQLADILTNERALFILWSVKTLFCTRKEDFLNEYAFTEDDLDSMLHRLKVLGFLQEDDDEFVLTQAGETAVATLGPPGEDETEEDTLAREGKDIRERFSLPKERIYVENQLLEELQKLGWAYPEERELETPYLAIEGRETYSDVLLKGRLREAIRTLNSDGRKPTPTDQQINEVIRTLEQVQPSGSGLLEANCEGRRLLLEGCDVSGTRDYLSGSTRRLRLIDIENPIKNDFFVLNQFRIETPGRGRFIIPDVVLFVNGIPLVVVECKSPDLTDPIESGVAQLRRYASEEEGVPDLFHFNILLISTCFYVAKLGTLGASAEDYQQWKDPYPLTREQLAQFFGVKDPQHTSSQQELVAGVLAHENLLDLLQNFVLFRTEGGHMVKLIARYQQFRAVQKAIDRLQHGACKTVAHDDQRGGIIWHTQGSGKSLTMVFLIRKMRSLSELHTFKVVIVTDRQDLQDQLAQTMQLTEGKILIARNIDQARALLARPGDDIIFVMIQKARGDESDDQDDYDGPTLGALNDSPNILLIVDEAHRSHTSKLHGNITNALPNSAKIGFTGTPIMKGTLKTTERIFGNFIDKYTILEAVDDGATVPIFYEGYQAYGIVVREEQLDQSYAYLTQAMPHEVRQQIVSLYAGETQVLEATELIEAKARHMLLHYAANILPDEFKAMIVTRSRQAAVRYQGAIMHARDHLVATLEQLDPALLTLNQEQRETLQQGTQMLLQAHPQLDLLKNIECAAVISAGGEDPDEWRRWSDESKQKRTIEVFKLPLGWEGDNLAILCVQRMLLTGFDIPVLQGLYLDQRLSGHNLLQAVARVNRTYQEKTHGLVVDYLGIARQLKEALLVYNAEDIQGALLNIQDELLKLEARHLRVKAIFSEKDIDISKIDLKRDKETLDACLNLLKDSKFRADFEEKLKKFLESMDAVLPRPEALGYIHDVEVLGYINKTAANFLPEEQINIKGTGKKVRKLIDEHIAVLGIEQTVAPISITDADFESKVDLHTSDETQASLMEHLARYYIREHYEEDPVYYEQLSKKLEDILQLLKENWTELARALHRYVRELRQGRPPDATGLDPRTQLPFLSILEEAASRGSDLFRISLRDHSMGVSQLTPEQRMQLARITERMVGMIRGRIQRVDFWRGSKPAHDLRADIMDFLDDNDIISPYERIHEVADRIIALAHHLHRWLVV